MTPDGQRLASLRPNLEGRAVVLAAIRSFFQRGDFLDVETPTRLPAPALELHIDAEPAGEAFLRTSPELHMKRLLGAGYDKIYQIGPCFRRGERGPRHHPEYTMLEWYRLQADYRTLLDDTRQLLLCVHAALGERVAPGPGLDQPWEVFPVSDIFRRVAGWDPAADWDADRFDLDLVEKVEPSLPRDRPVVLIDYPAPAAALSRRKPGHPGLAERWELYLGGVEIANAYSELTDPVEQRARFEQCAHERTARGKPVYPPDDAFLAALDAGLPPCAGIALGIDRLVMVGLGVSDLSGVIAFRENL